MGAWTFDTQTGIGGRFLLYVTKLTPGGRRTNVTFVRGVPTQLDSYSSADPFGDSTAVFSFPGLSVLDDMASPELSPWLDHYANVDLYWAESVPWDSSVSTDGARINPLTNKVDIVAPGWVATGTGGTDWLEAQVKVWEGFIASFEFSTTGLQVQCQGALYQLDRYLQKPFYPSRPWPIENLIADAFSRREKPQLRTRNLTIAWPVNWAKKVPKYTGAPTVYTPVATPGANWTGYTSRNTGAWEHTLTGFVQDQLTVLITDSKSGVKKGNQWTVQHQREAPGVAGRAPVLTVRERNRTPDLSVWAGAPGVEVQLSSDSTQSENVVYGTGTDLNGQQWRNAVINNNGTRTDYLPLAASRDIYPVTKRNAGYNRNLFVSEAYTNFGTGFSQEQATTIAEEQLARDEKPGWSGSITLAVDPTLSLPRWLIRAGMTVRLRGFNGTGSAGMNFHIASVEASPQQGTVTLTVDTRFRDLLTVAEAQARTRDPLTPVRMLQVNRTSVMIEDVQAPWDYTAGSGFVPKTSVPLFKNKPATAVYPYADWIRQHPPMHFPSYYVKVRANAAARKDRWSTPAVPVLTSEKGTINRAEFVCVDVYGRVVKAPYHLSFYYTDVTPAAMPRDGAGPSPYINGAFESVNPTTGQAWPAGNFLAPDDKFIIGWGNRSNGIYNRAGFSPGSEAENGNPTGLFFDDATWTFDNTSNPNYDRLAKPGQRQRADSITIYCMIYAEWSEPLYFLGRLYRQNPGQG